MSLHSSVLHVSSRCDKLGLNYAYRDGATHNIQVLNKNSKVKTGQARIV